MADGCLCRLPHGVASFVARGSGRAGGGGGSVCRDACPRGRGVAWGLRMSTSNAALNGPMLASWTGPYGGTPPFDRVRVADFVPALEAAMAENLREVDRIANQEPAPDFDNTLAALERAGHTFNR